MARFSFRILLIALCGMPLLAAAPAKTTVEEIRLRLERDIDRASERGQYQAVQILRQELAQHLKANGAYGLAARQYELLLASRPGRRERVGYSIELGKMRFAEQNYGAAIAAFEDALHDDPKSWEANLLLAKAFDRSELNSKAIEVYQRCIKLRLGAWEAYHGLGRVYQQLGFLNKAIANYQKAIAIDGKPETYLQLADAYTRQGDVSRAQATLKQAKSLLPVVDYDVRLGEIYSRQGDIRSACRAWEEAIHADAGRDDVRLQLALVYDRLERRAESDQMFTRLLAQYPASPLVHFSRAWVLYARGDRSGARRQASIAQELGPTAIVGHFNSKLLAELKK